MDHHSHGARIRTVVVLVMVFFTFLAAACGFPNGACDDYARESRGCTADGQIAKRAATSCKEPDGPVYATTVTACAAGLRCVELYKHGHQGPVCVRSCSADSDCGDGDRTACLSGICTALLGEGQPCSNDDPCAPRLSCVPKVKSNVDASTADSGDAGSLDASTSARDAGATATDLCARWNAHDNDCACTPR